MDKKAKTSQGSLRWPSEVLFTEKCGFGAITCFYLNLGLHIKSAIVKLLKPMTLSDLTASG